MAMDRSRDGKDLVKGLLVGGRHDRATASGDHLTVVAAGGGGSGEDGRKDFARRPVVVFVSEAEKKDVSSKCQFLYGFVMLGCLGILGLLLIISGDVPPAYRRSLFFFATALWGLASFGVHMELHGMNRFTRKCSQHFARFIFLCFSLLVLYVFYSVIVPPKLPPSTIHSILSSSTDHLPVAEDASSGLSALWYVYVLLGCLLVIGHVTLWVSVDNED